MQNIHVPVTGTVSGLILAGSINAGFDSLQQAIGGALTKSVAGGVDVTLSASEANYGIILLTGALTANINVIVPTSSMQWVFQNATTGAFGLTIKTAAGTGVNLAQGYSEKLYCDGTNVKQATSISVLDDYAPMNLNGTFEVNKRGQTSVADDVYCIDGFYVLTENGNVTVAQTTDPESGAPWGFRLTQPDASAKRMGLAMIIESKDCRKLRGAVATMASRVKFSTSGVLRYAILEHTGTADSVTSDVVNNWASTTFTAGNFFIAGLNVLQCGTVTPGAATWADLSGYGTAGASMNNLICLVWTEAAAAQNVTLEFNRFRCIPGAVVLPQRFRPNELSLCIRYFYKCPMAILARGYGNVGETNYSFPTPMRATPTLAGSVDSADATSTSITATADAVVFKATFGVTSSARYGYSADWTADAAL